MFNLSKKKIHLVYKVEFINFWRDMFTHEDIKIKCLGIYILPCMFLLFKDVQDECQIDFAQIYQQLLNEEGKIRRKTAMGLHEVFIMFKDTEEDMSPFKECFIDLLGDDTPKILKIVNRNLTTYLFNFINQLELAVKSPKSDDVDKKDNDNTFQQIDVSKKPNCKKRQQTLMISQMKDECSDDSKSNRRPNVFITDESSPELIYTD